MSANAIGNAPLLRDEQGYGIPLQAIRRRFWNARKAAGQSWEIRHLRAKAASDAETSEDACALLVHSKITFLGYRAHDMQDVITVSRLSKTYGSGQHALKGVDLAIRRGELFGLLGRTALARRR